MATTTLAAEKVQLRLIHYPGYDTTLQKPYWDLSDTIWYRDSFAVEEARYLHILDSSSVHKEENRLRCYRVSDLRADNYYEFARFGDTTSFMGAYSYRDTVPVWGGWLFKRNSHINYDGEPVALPDTVINHVRFRRLRTVYHTNNIPQFTICYFRCDRQGTVFNIDRKLSEKMDCPLTKTFSYPPTGLRGKTLRLSFEVIPLADTLDAAEEKAFRDWKLFIANHPVKPVR
ncbi:MAG: hypothetical protein NTW29_00100 [Bacteroidetes bacterium]|nr:hypothetical protein [Bacteroidota bacterium]